MLIFYIKFKIKYKENIMPFQTHDPYLNTVKRNINDKYYKGRKQYVEKNINKEQESKGFLSQKIYFSDFSNLDEGVLNILVFIAFVLIPYIAGLAFIFILIAHANFNTFKDININDYLIYWTIGYETLAFILMLFVIKSAISFKRFKHL